MEWEEIAGERMKEIRRLRRVVRKMEDEARMQSNSVTDLISELKKLRKQKGKRIL